MFIDFHGALIDIHLEHMSEYLEITQFALDEKKKVFNDYIKQKEKEMSEEDKEQFYDYNSFNYWKFHEVMPEYLYKSFIVSWYSFVENILSELCNNLQLKNKLLLSPKELEDKGVSRSRKYMRKIAGVTLIESHWVELLKVGKIRNLIIHNDGEIKESDNSLSTYLQEHNLLRGKDDDTLKPNVEFCKYLLKFEYGYFTNLFYDLGKTASRTSFARKIKNG